MKGLRLLISDNKILKFCLYKSIWKIWPFHKKVRVNLRSSFFETLLGPCPQWCIPSPRAIGPLVLEKKIFKGFLPFMGVTAILGMWPNARCCEQTFVPPTHWGSIWNLAMTGRVVSEKKTFEECRWWTDDNGWRDNEACLYFKLTYEP